ncbi:MAG: hypothetical protein BroJett033_3020 [Chloroflexota bacterium]|nr:MAG: hypothetical protein BroJett033_3020 [Chloroflexota bacterium]
MHYEAFLFTRSHRRDFTAFVRPRDLTNHEISVLAGAFSAVSDTSPLTAAWPALYCFPLGSYVLLLRHYVSRRTHAGRAIPVLEGAAVRRTQARHFALALPHFLAAQGTLLNIAASLPDIESLEPALSDERPWPVFDTAAAPAADVDSGLIEAFAARLTDDRLFIPFSADGLALLRAALADRRFPPLYFAFGTTAAALERLSQDAVQVDVVSYFSTQWPALRSRQTNEITSELAGYTPSASPAPDSAAAETAPAEAPLLTPRQMRDQAALRAPADDPLARYEAGADAALTPRELARRARELEPEPETEADKSLLGWLGGVLARLLGRR